MEMGLSGFAAGIHVDRVFAAAIVSKERLVIIRLDYFRAMRRILIFLLMVSALAAQEEEEVPALIVALEKEIATTEEAIADAKAGEDNDESTRKLAEDLAEELELKLAGLKELTSGGESGKATGELLEEAFQQSKEIMKGKLPYSVLETEERLQKHRIALVELKQELSLNSTKVPEEFSAAQKSKAVSLLKKRDKVLNDYQKVLELVIEDDEAALKASERVLQAAEELQTFVLPRIFWFRGADPLGIHTLKEAKEEFYQARDELWILGRELSQQTYKFSRWRI